MTTTCGYDIRSSSARQIIFVLIYFILFANCDNTDINSNFNSKSNLNPILIEKSTNFNDQFGFFNIFHSTLTQSVVSESDIGSVPPLNKKCSNHIDAIIDGLQQQDYWAIKLLDASGRIDSGFVYGGRFWLGSRSDCERLNDVYKFPIGKIRNKALHEAIAPFPVKFFVLYANVTSNFQYEILARIDIPFHIGVCMPSSCSEAEVLKLGKDYYGMEPLSWKKLYNATIDVFGVKQPTFTKIFQRLDGILLIGGLFGFIIFVILLNLYNSTTPGSLIQRISSCFSIDKNLHSTMSTTPTKNSLVPLDAMRTITCLIIMGGHIQVFSNMVYKNGSELIISSYNIFSQLLFFCCLHVDVFFVISGLLLVYNFLENEKQQIMIKSNKPLANIRLFAKIIFRRYLRLTPAFFLALCLTQITSIYLEENSVFYVGPKSEFTCELSTLWQRLFYVHAYWDSDKSCGMWTWYVSCDMHYYCITLLGLFLYAKYPNLAKYSFFVMSAASIIYTLQQSLKYGLSLEIDTYFDIFKELYTHPAVRMNPYFGGIYGGYLFYKLKKDPVVISKTQLLSWFMTVTGIIIGIYLTFNNQNLLPKITAPLVNSIGRYIFGYLYAITALIFIFNSGGIFARIVTSNIFIHFNKLSYMMYLIDPIVIGFYRGLSDKATNYDLPTIYVEAFGIMLVCYLLSIFFVVIVEKPFLNISKEFFSNETSTKKSQ